jgi:GntR family transcriptional repressor for pyruvate dehydrogenase complex
MLMNALRSEPADDLELEGIVAAVRAVIADGRPVPPERTLAEDLNVKRHRLRRALEVLRAAGEIDPPKAGRRGSGTPRHGEELIRGTNPLEVIELRIMLEPMLARLAAVRASPAEIARITQTATTPAGANYGNADLAFHKAVAAGARNGLAVELYQLLRQVGTDARVRLGNAPPMCDKRLARRDSEHRAIAEAIAARDPEGAEQAMRAHLSAVQRQIIERLTPGLTAA